MGICKLCGETIKTKDEVYRLIMGKSCRLVHLKCRQNKDDMTDDEVLELVKSRSSRQKKKVETRKKCERDFFIDYIMETYNLTMLPSYTYVKLASITKGEYKDMKEAISYEDLLDMFKRQQSNLNKIHARNITKGNNIEDSLSLFNYDLAIILSKYDSYKKWKEKQKITEVETRQIEEEFKALKIDYSKVNKQNNKTNYDDSIDDILDDLF